MHSVGFILNVSEDEADRELEQFLEDYEGDEREYLYYDNGDYYDTFEEMAQDHPEVRTDSTTWGTLNPYSQCDYYTIGGRWAGYFTTKSGEKVDATTIGEIDFDWMEGNARKKARETYAKILEVIGNDKNFLTFDQIEKRHRRKYGPGIDYDAIREEYGKQPQVKAWRDWKSENDPNLKYLTVNADVVLRPQREYEDEVVVNKMTPCAVVDNGSWDEVPHSARDGLKWLRWFKGLPADTKVVMFDYHT